MPQALQLHELDNVAVCTADVHVGDTVEILTPDRKESSVVSRSNISYCNKIALVDIAEGAWILKYGETIGKAIETIPCGALVNHENIASQPRSYADEYLVKEG